MQVSVLLTLKRGVLFFWALWLAIVFLANLCDLLKQRGVLGQGWKFASGNYEQMRRTTERYHLPDAAVTLLFVGVLLWEALAALLMAGALLSFVGGVNDTVYAAFGVSLALWAAFMIADELCMAYETQTTHVAIFVAQMVTLLAICLLA